MYVIDGINKAHELRSFWKNTKRLHIQSFENVFCLVPTRYLYSTQSIDLYRLEN